MRAGVNGAVAASIGARQVASRPRRITSPSNDRCSPGIDAGGSTTTKQRRASSRPLGFRLRRPRVRLFPRMRFFEYEAKEIVRRAGIPTSKGGFATTADEARRIAEDVGGPVVIKSQVLTGGRMKAGGVQFADAPDEAAKHAEDVLALEINGHMPRGVLVDER